MEIGLGVCAMELGYTRAPATRRLPLVIDETEIVISGSRLTKPQASIVARARG